MHQRRCAVTAMRSAWQQKVVVHLSAGDKDKDKDKDKVTVNYRSNFTASCGCSTQSIRTSLQAKAHEDRPLCTGRALESAMLPANRNVPWTDGSQVPQVSSFALLNDLAARTMHVLKRWG